MNEILNNWNELNKVDFSVLAKDSNTVHHAAQLMAYAAKRLIPEKEDDSHTSSYWIPNKNFLEGREINTDKGKVRIALNYPELKLMITDDKLNVIHQKAFIGNTKGYMLEWLASELKTLGLHTDHFDGKMHYEIPSHEVENGSEFEVLDEKNLIELANYRTNGHLIITYFASRFSSADEVLVWPHHFDEGLYIPLKFENGAATHSVGIGLAVPDSYYDNPYFYVTTWAKDGMEYNDLPETKGPGKWHTHEWTGQVLEGKDLTGLRKEAQAETAIHFMETAIQNALDLVNN